jgi:peroxiredoxin
MKIVVTIMIALSLLAPRAAKAAVWNVGPAAGATAPPLHATDLKGDPVTVHGLSGKTGLVLVFFRSAKWCPFCQKQLVDLKDAPAPLAARGYKLAAISYDPVDVLARFSEKREISYPLLSDAGSVTIDAWKLRDLRYKPDSYAWGVPYASIYVLSPAGVLKAKLSEEDFKVRPPISAILSAIDSLPGAR